MVLKKEKGNKLTIRPTSRKGEIIPRRPYDLWTELDRMFDDFRSSFDDLLWPWNRRANTDVITRTPPLDLADLGDKYELNVEIPGIPKNDINIEVTPNSVEISAEHKEEKKDKGKNWIRQERSSMKFYRSLELPEELKTENAEAELKDGILTITLPKVKPSPEYKPKKVKIK